VPHELAVRVHLHHEGLSAIHAILIETLSNEPIKCTDARVEKRRESIFKGRFFK
jgi:hypothetical protein